MDSVFFSDRYEKNPHIIYSIMKCLYNSDRKYFYRKMFDDGDDYFSQWIKNHNEFNDVLLFRDKLRMQLKNTELYDHFKEALNANISVSDAMNVKYSLMYSLLNQQAPLMHAISLNLERLEKAAAKWEGCKTIYYSEEDDDEINLLIC